MLLLVMLTKVAGLARQDLVYAHPVYVIMSMISSCWTASFVMLVAVYCCSTEAPVVMRSFFFLLYCIASKALTAQLLLQCKPAAKLFLCLQERWKPSLPAGLSIVHLLRLHRSLAEASLHNLVLNYLQDDPEPTKAKLKKFLESKGIPYKYGTKTKFANFKQRTLE